MAGRWKEAIADFRFLVDRDPERGNLVALAIAQSGAGQDAAYRETVRCLADRVARQRVVGAVGLAFGQTPANGLGLVLTAHLAVRPLPAPTIERFLVAELGTARPDGLESEELLAVAERAGPEWRGPALVRANRFDEAVQALAKWEIWPNQIGLAYRRLFVALAEHGRGDTAKARQAYSQASSWLDAPSMEDPQQTNFSRLDWGVRTEIDVLRREVEEMLRIPREPGQMKPIRDP
jgi:hypothetical protein